MSDLTPTPKTDAFSQRIEGTKVPKLAREKHWYDFASSLERAMPTIPGTG